MASKSRMTPSKTLTSSRESDKVHRYHDDGGVERGTPAHRQDVPL
jgi:hypothetical protein